MAIARHVRDPFEVVDTYYTAAWAAYEVGHYRTAVDLCAEFEAGDYAATPLGVLSLSVLARVVLGEWDEGLAEQARVRELLGDQASDAPSFASGGYGAEAFMHEARGETAAAEAIRREIEVWYTSERPRKWPLPLLILMLARRGEFSAAREALAMLADRRIYLPRELEVRCTLIAEQGTWDEAEEVIARSRRHAADARLLSLPLHADRLQGRALLAEGNATAAVGPLERAASGFAELDARWEIALTELSLGEALLLAERNAEAALVLERAAGEFNRLRVPREAAQAQAFLDTIS